MLKALLTDASDTVGLTALPAPLLIGEKRASCTSRPPPPPPPPRPGWPPRPPSSILCCLPRLTADAADSEAVRCSAGSGGFRVSGVLGFDMVAVVGDIANGYEGKYDIRIQTITCDTFGAEHGMLHHLHISCLKAA